MLCELLVGVGQTEPLLRFAPVEEWPHLDERARSECGELSYRAKHERVRDDHGAPRALEAMPQSREPQRHGFGLGHGRRRVHTRDVDELWHGRPQAGIDGQALEEHQGLRRADRAAHVDVDDANCAVDRVVDRHSSGARSRANGARMRHARRSSVSYIVSSTGSRSTASRSHRCIMRDAVAAATSGSVDVATRSRSACTSSTCTRATREADRVDLTSDSSSASTAAFARPVVAKKTSTDLTRSRHSAYGVGGGNLPPGVGIGGTIRAPRSPDAHRMSPVDTPRNLSRMTLTTHTRQIPSSGEAIAVIGLGTWRSFDVGRGTAARAPLEQCLAAFDTLGGGMIDSSPMYGNAEQVVGDLVASLGIRDRVFVATKVWTSGRQRGIEQMKDSMRKLRVDQVDLMQVHNLVDVETHL